MKQDATPGAGPQEDHAAQADEGLGDQVEEIVNALLKAVRARQTYVPGNPLVDRFHGELCDRLRFLWERRLVANTAERFTDTRFATGARSQIGPRQQVRRTSRSTLPG